MRLLKQRENNPILIGLLATGGVLLIWQSILFFMDQDRSRFLEAQQMISQPDFNPAKLSQSEAKRLIKDAALSFSNDLEPMIAKKQTGVVKLFLRAGLSSKYISRFGDHLIFMICEDEWAETLSGLLKGGVDPNTMGVEGLTPLHKAVLSRQPKTARVLLSFGADINRKDRDGIMPMTRLHQELTKRLNALYPADGSSYAGDQQSKANLNYEVDQLSQIAPMLVKAGADLSQIYTDEGPSIVNEAETGIRPYHLMAQEEADVSLSQKAEVKAPLNEQQAAIPPDLINGLNGSDPIKKKIAAKQLGSLGPSAAGYSYLLQAALSDSNNGVRAEAAAALGEISEQNFSAMASLIAIVSNPAEDHHLRFNSAFALAMMNAPDPGSYLPVLIKTFQHSDSEESFNRGQKALVKQGDASVDHLVNAYESHEAPWEFVLRALQQINSKKSDDAIIALNARRQGHDTQEDPDLRFRTRQSGYWRYRSRNPKVKESW